MNLTTGMLIDMYVKSVQLAFITVHLLKNVLVVLKGFHMIKRFKDAFQYVKEIKFITQKQKNVNAHETGFSKYSLMSKGSKSTDKYKKRKVKLAK